MSPLYGNVVFDQNGFQEIKETMNRGLTGLISLKFSHFVIIVLNLLFIFYSTECSSAATTTSIVVANHVMLTNAIRKARYETHMETLRR